MRLKRQLCQSWKLYTVTESVKPQGRDLLQTLRAAADGGVSVIQLRDKKCSDGEMIAAAKEILRFTRSRGIPLIINDRVQVAKECGADGVHLGQDDASIAEARIVLGKNFLIGKSTHSPEQALQAEREGFDYIGIGPVFGTPTKPDYKPVGLELVRFAAKTLQIPFVAIGGINQTNVRLVAEAGARTVAVVRAVMNSLNPKEACEQLLKELSHHAK